MDAGTTVARRGVTDRLLAAIPLASIVLWLSLVYMWQSVGRSTPTIFVDELKWAQLSRGVAATGHAMQRGVDAPFGSLLSYVIAPAWWADDTGSAYDAAKYITVFAMCLAAVPAYALARRLLESKALALFVAAATISIPSMAYGLYLIPEPIAYPWATLCALLGTGALATRSPRWIVPAVAAAAVAPAVRSQLSTVAAAFALAAVGLWWVGPRGRRLRARWSVGDRFGVALLAVGAFLALNRWLLHDSQPWAITSEFYRDWIVHHLVWALGALTIGTAVLPTFGAVLAFFPRRDEELDSWHRSFLALLAAYAVAFGAYTGVKAAYLQYEFGTRVTERNVIYLAPLVFLAAAVAFERRRARPVSIVVALGLVAYLLHETPTQLDYPYFEALGFSLLSVMNREVYWSQATLGTALWVTLGVVVVLWLAAWRLQWRPVARIGRRWSAGAVAVVCVAVLAWSLAGEFGAADGSARGADQLLGHLPQPPDWVDRATGGRTVTLLGTELDSDDGLGENIAEFWNRSIVNVWSLDGSAPGPGGTLSPDLFATDGTLSNPPGTPYLLAVNDVDPAGTPLARRGTWRLYRLNGSIRLASWTDGVQPDGWIGGDSAYSRFGTGAGRRGTLVVSMSRAGFCPDKERRVPPARVQVSVGQLVIDDNNQPALGKLLREEDALVPNCDTTTLQIEVPPPPWRVQIHLEGTFRPSDYGGTDTRDLGAVVGYRFVPVR